VFLKADLRLPVKSFIIWDTKTWPAKHQTKREDRKRREVGGVILSVEVVGLITAYRCASKSDVVLYGSVYTVREHCSTQHMQFS